jgi:hypothetical protein
MEEEDELELKLPKIPKLTREQLDTVILILMIIAMVGIAIMYYLYVGARIDFQTCLHNLTICRNRISCIGVR